MAQIAEPEQRGQMPLLVIARTAVETPMGAQVYQAAIAERAGQALGPDWRVTSLVTRSMRSSLPGTHRIPAARLGRAPAPVRRAAGRLLYPRSASVVHRMTLELPPAPGPEVLTLHDVIAWKYPDESPPVAAAVGELRRAAAVICVSRYTAQEAVALLGIHDPVVVPNGVADRFFDAPALSAASLERLGVPRPFVLASGGASERKNLAALAAAWPDVHRARPDLTLVMTGPPHPRRSELFRGLDAVRMVGMVDDELMPGLMAAAEALVVPSKEEGFGLPALEAMATRTPVVAADTSSFPEVVGDAGLLVDPTPPAIAEGIVHATSGASDVTAMVERGAERARHFTWRRSAEGHAAVWQDVASRA
jgi:glycosyltransferase involved in cell wall biosynthesis